MNHEINRKNNVILVLEALKNLVVRFFIFLWEKRKPITIGVIIGGLALSFFYLGGSYVAWKNEKPRVVKSLDKFSGEINNFYDAFQPKPIVILDKNGVRIGEFYRKNFRPIRTDNLKDHKVFIWALLSSEDREFYNHSGINIISVLRAVVVNLVRFRFSQGGSTITQQLAKLTLNLGERNIFNKLTEVYATYYIESNFNKDEILAMYLNQIYLGQDNYGVEAASRYYFDKPASELSPAEAAMLVGTIPAPSVYNAVDRLHIALSRQRIVLVEMARTKDPNIRPAAPEVPSNFDSLLDESIRKFRKLYKVEEKKEDEKIVKITSSIASKGYDRNFNINLAPDFNLDIRRYILDNYSEEDLEGREITVHTTLDYEKQKIAETALREGITAIRSEILALANPPKKKTKNSPKPLSSDLANEIASGMRGSFVSLVPDSGEVEVFVNNLRISTSYRPNRIETSYRQPGSTIKALVYALAYEKRLVHPSSKVIDEKISFAGYSPKNWYAGYRGEITVRNAFAQSINTISVKLLNDIGIDYFFDKLGEILSLDDETIKKRFNRNLTLALGSGELTPMELAVIYATIQNGGKKIVPRKIRKVTDNLSTDDFNLLQPETYQVLDPIACAMATDTLQSVLTEEGTMPIRIPSQERFPMGGKTGTVQSPKEARKKWGDIVGVRDAWFSGLIPGAASVVWIGNEWGAPFPGSGSGTTGRVWWKFASSLGKRTELGNKLISSEVHGSFLRLDICADDGTQLETDWEKEFLASTPSVISSPVTEEKESKTAKKDPKEAIEKVEPKIPNPRYCKFPLFGQYYYIGDGAPRREIAVVRPTLENYDPEAREGESEVNEIDKENPSTTNGNNTKEDSIEQAEPVREGGVELDEPFIDNPAIPDNL
ncbi:transglycosylase domain-containing protein [Leptospira sp. GIMC2001]|uniref:transglycosylase domain-containing protein n=1 Tax=Leptospira sp. GIMC2001 TaxID=1513297 RepID=UPI002348F88E|nr:transglycosylase domain-containing protein [Leptospira sp. GIMC2001]WCL50394.1 transglycosylase domain-containing protein [Leptospira sp. GIMC2001]